MSWCHRGALRMGGFGFAVTAWMLCVATAAAVEGPVGTLGAPPDAPAHPFPAKAAAPPPASQPTRNDEQNRGDGRPLGEMAPPNDRCGQAGDISGAVNQPQDGSMQLWILPHSLSPAIPEPVDIRYATASSSTDTPTCGYDPPGNTDNHYQSVWYSYRPPQDGTLYITPYPPSFTRGGAFGAMQYNRSTYDTVITVYSEEAGHGCGAFATADWPEGAHNGQMDRRDYYAVPLGETPFPASSGSWRERAANDTFWPGVRMADSPGSALSSAVCAEVRADVRYRIMVQSWSEIPPSGAAHLILYACFLPGRPSAWALNAQALAVGLAANGMVFDGEWLANFDRDGDPSNLVPDFALDPFNSIYFWCDEPAWTADGDGGWVWGPNRKAERFFAAKNFTADAGTDPLTDFQGVGFASRIAPSQVHGWFVEGQQEGVTGTASGHRMNRYFVGTRALDNDPGNPMESQSGHALTFDDRDNLLRFSVTSSASQNFCNLAAWPPGAGDYAHLSSVYGPVATAAVKAPVSSWIRDRNGELVQGLKPAANVGGDALSGEIAVHLVNDAPVAGPSIACFYDEDDADSACGHGPSNAGDTGPTWGRRVYLRAPSPDGPGLPVQTILAGAVGLDDTVKAFDCPAGEHSLGQTGLLVPAEGLPPSPVAAQSVVIYFIDGEGNLWAARDLGHPGDASLNGMPNLEEPEAYSVLVPAGAGGGEWDLRNAVFMTYNGTTGEILIALHGTGGGLSQAAAHGSMILSIPDTGSTPPGYLGVVIHDPSSIGAGRVARLAWNHRDGDQAPDGDPDYLFNFDNTTGTGTHGAPGEYPPGASGTNPYSGHVYRPTFNAGLAVGPTDPGIVNRGQVTSTQHIFALAGREDYDADAYAPEQQGGADPNRWMTHILDFFAPYPHHGAATEDQLSTWAQDLPYTSRCEGYYHGVTGLARFHDNSRPDVWFTATAPIPGQSPAEGPASGRTCEPMSPIAWGSEVALAWRSWDFVGSGVAGYDGYLMVHDGQGPASDGESWTHRSLFGDAEVAGGDRAHTGVAHATQSARFGLPPDLSGEAFLRLVAYDREGHSGFCETNFFLCPRILLDPLGLPTGWAGRPYPTTSIAAQGGRPPHALRLDGDLPPGMAFAGGALAGTPTRAGEYRLTATATDANGCQGSWEYDLVVSCLPMALAPPSLPGAQVGSAFSEILTATGGTEPFAFAVSEGALPPGLSLDAGGVISGVPTAAGTWGFAAVATDSYGCRASAHYDLSVCPAIALAPPSLADGLVRTPYVEAIEASGGAEPYSFEVTGSLPPGLRLEASGMLFGVPEDTGAFAFAVTATDAQGCAGKKPYALYIASGLPVDCDGDGTLSIGEVQRIIGMFLGTQAVACGADCDGDGAVSVGELQRAIGVFLGVASGC